MKHVIWALVTVAAFLIGMDVGREQRTTVPGGPPASGGTGSGSAAVGGRATVPADARASAGRAPSASDWTASLDRLDELTRSGESAAAVALSGRLLGDLQRLARDGEVGRADHLLGAYLERNPQDPDAYLLESDLRQMQGRQAAALAPLLDLLEFADDPAVVARARDRLALLVNAREAQLANTGDVAALIRLFQDLSQRDPGFDGHRLRLVHWLLQAGRVDDAEQVLAETGTAGVDPREREDLAEQVRAARSGLPLERRDDGSWHVRARMGGAPLDLLVDTGATTTAISRARADAMAAEPTGVRVKVRTANGVVESEVHRVSPVDIGGVHLDSLNVLVLDGPLPKGADGLLGMDVLSRFPAIPGVGTAAASAEP